MNPSITAPAPAGFDISVKPNDRAQAPRLVIFQPMTIWAEAIEAVVHQYTRWHVACATTIVAVATAAAVACGATALLFDTRSGSAMSLTALIRQLRSACPDVPLILLTEHEGNGFLNRAVSATLSAIVLKHDSVAVFRAALDAVENGRRYYRHGVGTRAVTASGVAESSCMGVADECVVIPTSSGSARTTRSPRG
jgi:DNA-binding NarL/FixJ family response regulator